MVRARVKVRVRVMVRARVRVMVRIRVKVRVMVRARVKVRVMVMVRGAVPVHEGLVRELGVPGLQIFEPRLAGATPTQQIWFINTILYMITT